MINGILVKRVKNQVKGTRDKGPCFCFLSTHAKKPFILESNFFVSTLPAKIAHFFHTFVKNSMG